MLEIHPERSVELTSLDKGERGRLREIIGAVLLAILVFGSLIYAGKSFADTTTMVYSDPQVTLRLLNKPCINQTVLSYLKQEARPKYQEAVFVWEGRTLQSCWRLTDDQKAVLNVDEEGDGLNPPLPIELFKKDSGA
jgi:hypothetical protein